MEERMACGLGTCVGCVVKVGENYVRVCREGPVFYSDEVF
jgi:dihydroorotate dehydrogenase electron transfer subunit